MSQRTQQRTPRWLPLLICLGLLLTACAGSDPAATPEVDSSAEIEFQTIVTATGIVVPAQWAELSVGASGRVVELPVEVGDQVQAGELLLAMSGRENMEAAVAAAELEAISARQALAELEEGAELARALMEQELALARDALKDAEYLQRVRQQGNRASAETIDAAEARLVLAENSVDRAKAAYDHLSGRDSDDPARAQALRNLSNARMDRDAALRALNWYTGSPTELEQSMLDADVAVAAARVAEAEMALARMQDGPEARALEAAEARLANAERQLAAAQAALAEVELRAPFDGTVSDVMVRTDEWLMMGQAAVILGDLTGLRIETTDLNEIDAARVRPGDPVSVAFDALPEQVVSGEVIRVAPRASTGSGVNYTALIAVSEIPAEILWGMTAFVDIEVEQ